MNLRAVAKGSQLLAGPRLQDASENGPGSILAFTGVWRCH